MAYRDKAKDGGGLDGIYVLQPGSESRMWQLKSGGTTVFRPYPCPQPNSQEFFPARLSTTRCDFSDFAEIAEGVAYNGQHRKLTYITEYPGMQDVDESPSKRFFRVISAAVKNRSHLEWIDYIEGPNNIKKDAYIKRPSSYLFLQGFLKLHSNKVVDKHGVILMIKQSGRQSFEELMSEPSSTYKHPGDSSPIDMDSFFKNPDPTDIKNGCYLTFTLRPASKASFAGYEVSLGDKCSVAADDVRKNWTPWEQVLRYMPIEEQMALLISAFPKPLIYFAFQDTDWLSKEFLDEYMAEQQAAQVMVGGQAPVTQPQGGQAPVTQPQGGQAGGQVPVTQPQGGQAPITQEAPVTETPSDLPGYPSQEAGAAPSPALEGIQPSHATAPQEQAQATPDATYMSEAVAASQEEMTPEAKAALAQLTGMNESMQEGGPQAPPAQ